MPNGMRSLSGPMIIMLVTAGLSLKGGDPDAPVTGISY